MAPIERKPSAPKIPPVYNWRTTDEDEIERRRLRARSEHFTISNLDAKHPIFSNFHIRSGSGLTYCVEIRSVRERQFACSCVDFRINGLGTCKHAEAVLLHLEGRYKKLFKAAGENGSYRIDIVPDHAADTLRLAGGLKDLTRPLRRLFDKRGVLRDGHRIAEQGGDPGAAHLPGRRAVGAAKAPGDGAQVAAQGVRAEGAHRRVAAAGDPGPAVPLPAPRHAGVGAKRWVSSKNLWRTITLRASRSLWRWNNF